MLFTVKFPYFDWQMFVAYQVGAILKASADIGNEELTPSGIATMEWYSKIFQL